MVGQLPQVFIQCEDIVADGRTGLHGRRRLVRRSVGRFLYQGHQQFEIDLFVPAEFFRQGIEMIGKVTYHHRGHMQFEALFIGCR